MTELLSPSHLAIVLLVALLVLGPKRLPEVGRSLGRGLRDFREALNGSHAAPSEPPTSASQPMIAGADPAPQDETRPR